MTVDADPTSTESSLDFDEVYVRYFHHVSRWIRALGGPTTDLDDLTQETFIVVQRKLDQFDGRHLSAWLYRIAKNVVSDHRRRAWFRRFGRGSDLDLDAVGSVGDGPSEIAEKREAERTLEAVLARMSPAHRAAFVLYEVEGYTGEDIAAMEQIPVNTVYTRLHHARKQFVELVAAHTAGEERAR
jgi:RNA polymerase sigma-70 factor (ECF subfamily)